MFLSKVLCSDGFDTDTNIVFFFLLAQSLALAHADVDDGKVVFVPWVETDFRTGDAPWWA